MKKNLRSWIIAAVGVAALALTSCAYDPYYSSSYGGGSYSSGYGSDYGYGGSSFSTSLFVSTGNPRWGYDPHCYSYYDYRTRRYYDPYLHGYYPVGYRPPVVYGVPHPHGWRPGRGHISPPSRYSDRSLSNYRNRDSAYRNTDYSWARQVRQQQTSRSIEQGRTRPGSRDTQSDRVRSGFGNPGFGGSGMDRNRQSPSRESIRPPTRQQAPTRYNSPVNQIEQARERQRGGVERSNQGQRPQLGVPREAPSVRQRGERPDISRQPAQRPEPRSARPQPQAQPQMQRQPSTSNMGRGRQSPSSNSDEGRGRRSR